MDIRNYFKVITKEQNETTEEICTHVTKYQLGENSWIEQGIISPDIHYNFNTLWNLHPKEYGQVRIAGKYVNTPRWQQSYCKPYWFSGMHHDALPLPDEFKPFLLWANTLFDDWAFNQVLINHYSDGRHYIGAHTDNEQQIVPNSPIVSISLGQTRLFRVRTKNTKEIVLDLEMLNKTYLAMCGRIQKEFTHEVPKVQGKKGSDMGKRINITFRVFR